MTYSTCRLEGRGLEETLVAELRHKAQSLTGIRMRDASGQWQLITALLDGRVGHVLLRMRVVAAEVVMGLKAGGWTIRRADQICELLHGFGAGDQHSIDLVAIAQNGRSNDVCNLGLCILSIALVLEKNGVVVFVEVKWSPKAITAARAAGKEVLQDWLRAAMGGCIFIYPSGARRKFTGNTVGVLVVSQSSWALEIDSDVASDLSGQLSAPCKTAFKESLGRQGNSGSAKRSRSSIAKATEKSRRRGEGRAAHNAYTQASMAKRRQGN